MKIKKSIKLLVPEIVLKFYSKRKQKREKEKKFANSWKIENSFYNYDINRNLKYSKSINNNDSSEKIISSIIVTYHTLEKGMTMGIMRLGFGQDKIEKLIDLCDLYINKYNTTNEMLLEAIGVISEYDTVHKQSNYILNNKLQKKIDQIRSNCNNQYITHQLLYSEEDFFSKSDSPFDIFSSSRFSLRDFSKTGNIDLKIIEKSVALAQNAPSTCNRQSVRIHIIADKKMLSEVLLLQHGNRGFGNRADKLIIVTSDLQDWHGGNERYGPYLDAGIYTMNLLYSLHFYKVGACALNWYTSIENDIKLRELVGIPDNEIVVVIIACGLLKAEFKIAKSKRRNYKSIMRICK